MAPQEDGHEAVLQVVGRRVDIALLERWNGANPGTRIVAIGAPGSIERTALCQRFDACIAT